MRDRCAGMIQVHAAYYNHGEKHWGDERHYYYYFGDHVTDFYEHEFDHRV